MISTGWQSLLPSTGWHSLLPSTGWHSLLPHPIGRRASPLCSRALRTLGLGSNQITAIPQNAFNGVSELTYLHLSNNQITAIRENAFNGLSELTQLRLDGNQISDAGMIALVDAIRSGALASLKMLVLDARGQPNPKSGMPA